ncbi:hypothetical protein J6590_035790 [Homalodisca vitripennis]|nr:hypothetical protein J6590_035790 [Homalodisca vitripennis]
MSSLCFVVEGRVHFPEIHDIQVKIEKNKQLQKRLKRTLLVFVHRQSNISSKDKQRAVNCLALALAQSLGWGELGTLLEVGYLKSEDKLERRNCFLPQGRRQQPTGVLASGYYNRLGWTDGPAKTVSPEQMSSSSSPEVVVTILQSYLKVSLLTHMTTTGRSERKSGQERLYPWIQHVKL